MRLIDIEPLQNALYNVHHHEGMSLVPMVTLNAVYELIADQPTIDAVPVGWLEDQTKHSDFRTQMSAEWILGCWKKAREVQREP